MAPDYSSSSPHSPKRSPRISGSTEGKSPTIHSSPSQSQRPTRLPPLPPRPATALSPGSQPPNCNRTTSRKSRNPTTANTQITQPSGTNSQTVQESGPQENPTNGSGDNDGVHQDPQLSAASRDRQIIRELFPAIEQELLCTDEALPQGLMEALCFLPSSSPHVRRTIARPLGIPINRIGPLTPESVSSNDDEADRRANNEVIVSRMVFSRFAPQDDDLDYDIWVGPPPGYYKLNVAVTLCYSGGVQMLGLGAVVRDNFGAAQAAISLRWNNLNTLPAESLIYDMGIVYCLLWGYERLIAETESPLLVQQYRAFAQNPGLHFGSFTYFYARVVWPNANTVAHRFARMAPLVETVFWTAQDIANFFGSNSMPY